MSIVEKTLRRMQEAAARPPANSGPLPLPSSIPPTSVEVLPQRSTAAPVDPARILPVNMAGLRAAGLLPPEHEQHHIAQQYRQLKRPLIANALGRGAPRLPSGHLIMIASAMPGEGKTFTSLNLALSMSLEKDLRVLLVDADVAKADLSGVLGVRDATGLLDTLRDPALDIERAILPTDIPNLEFLPAGRRSEEATELLASPRMESVVRAMGAHDDRRIVLFDSPPLMLTTESHVLTQLAGQVLVVVRAGDTPQQVVLEALAHLKGHPAVSLVLNQSMAASLAGYYGAGYGASHYSEQAQPDG